jgi:hypothetical protein
MLENLILAFTANEITQINEYIGTVLLQEELTLSKFGRWKIVQKAWNPYKSSDVISKCVIE